MHASAKVKCISCVSMLCDERMFLIQKKVFGCLVLERIRQIPPGGAVISDKARGSSIFDDLTKNPYSFYELP